MSKLKSNLIYNVIYQILILIIPFLTTPYISRMLGAEGVGVYSYTYSIVNYFMMFALLGMNNYGNREVSKIKDNKEKLAKTFSGIYYLQLFITFLVTCIYLIYIFKFKNEYFLAQLIQSIYLISVAFDINWFFCGLQEFKVTITRSIFIKLITFISIFIFVKNENDVYKYIFILAFTTLLNQIILWPFLRKYTKFVKVKFNDIIKHLKPTMILFIPILATSVYRIMDKIMLGNMSDITQVGYYENAEKMLNIILSVVGALGTVTLPEMTYLYSKKKFYEFNSILVKSINLVFFIVFPVIFGFIVTADSLVYFYLGEGFWEAASLLKVLSISLLFSPISNIVRMQLLIPKNKDKEYILAVVLGAIINFSLNLILINKFNAIGASISTIVAEFVVALVQYLFIGKEISITKIAKNVFKFFVSSLVMFILILFVGKYLNNMLIRLIAQVILGALIYFILNINFIKNNFPISKILSKFKVNK